MEITKKNIINGLTFQGFISILGIIVFIGSLFVIRLDNFLIPGVLLILTGLSLFMNIKGILINLKNGWFKPYTYLLIFKIGKRHKLEDYKKITISTKRESIKMNSRGTTGDYQTTSFNVYLSGQSEDKALLKTFVKKEKAEHFKNEMEILLSEFLTS